MTKDGVDIIMFEKISYFIKQGAGSIVRHKAMSVASVCIVAASLILLRILASEGLNINALMNKLGNSKEINVYIARDTKGHSIEDIESELKSIHGIGGIKFFSREDRLQKVANEIYGDEEYLFSGDENPLRDSYVVTVSDVTVLEDICHRIEGIGGVEEVVRSGDVINGLDALTSGMQSIYFWLMLIFLLISMFIISNTVKLGINSRSDEITVMKAVGATNGFIIAPFVVEAFLLGMIGATIASVAVVAGYAVLIGRTSLLIPSSIISFVNVGRIATVTVPLFFATGIIIAIAGCVLALRKHLKQ